MESASRSLSRSDVNVALAATPGARKRRPSRKKSNASSERKQKSISIPDLLKTMPSQFSEVFGRAESIWSDVLAVHLNDHHWSALSRFVEQTPRVADDQVETQDKQMEMISIELRWLRVVLKATSTRISYLIEKQFAIQKEWREKRRNELDRVSLRDQYNTEEKENLDNHAGSSQRERNRDHEHWEEERENVFQVCKETPVQQVQEPIFPHELIGEWIPATIPSFTSVDYNEMMHHARYMQHHGAVRSGKERTSEFSGSRYEEEGKRNWMNETVDHVDTALSSPTPLPQLSRKEVSCSAESITKDISTILDQWRNDTKKTSLDTEVVDMDLSQRFRGDEEEKCPAQARKRATSCTKSENAEKHNISIPSTIDGEDESGKRDHEVSVVPVDDESAGHSHRIPSHFNSARELSQELPCKGTKRRKRPTSAKQRKKKVTNPHHASLHASDLLDGNVFEDVPFLDDVTASHTLCDILHISPKLHRRIETLDELDVVFHDEVLRERQSLLEAEARAWLVVFKKPVLNPKSLRGALGCRIAEETRNVQSDRAASEFLSRVLSRPIAVGERLCSVQELHKAMEEAKECKRTLVNLLIHQARSWRMPYPNIRHPGKDGFDHAARKTKEGLVERASNAEKDAARELVVDADPIERTISDDGGGRGEEERAIAGDENSKVLDCSMLVNRRSPRPERPAEHDDEASSPDAAPSQLRGANTEESIVRDATLQRIPDRLRLEVGESEDFECPLDKVDHNQPKDVPECLTISKPHPSEAEMLREREGNGCEDDERDTKWQLHSPLPSARQQDQTERMGEKSTSNPTPSREYSSASNKKEHSQDKQCDANGNSSESAVLDRLSGTKSVTDEDELFQDTFEHE